MKKFVVFLSLLLSVFFSFSQIVERFNDPNFPNWVGSRELFMVNADYQLQLNDTEAKTAYVSLHTPPYNNVWEWNFYIRLNFSPSNNNFARVYLTANSTDLSSMFLKGYYLQFGENLALDAIELFYQDGMTHTSVCRGKEKRIANRFAINIKVRYTESSHWEILVDELQNGIYEIDALGVSVEQFEHMAMGIFCKYTLTNVKNFYFDDFYYGPPIVDTVKPKIHRNDILITEIMAKPNPVAGLPDCEYVELHNFGIPDTVVLKNWRLQINTSNKNLPEIRIPPNGYVFLIANACTGYGEETEPNMCRISSLGIADGGTAITLYNESGEVIHEVRFSSSWHRNKHKADGGWSLEMIDSRNPCTGKDNWDSSVSSFGGTPGKQNSIYGTNPDFIPPEIEKVTVVDSMQLRIFFTETIFFNPFINLQLFEIDRNIKIASVSEVPSNNHVLQILLQNPIQPNVLYTLTIKEPIWDCVQNTVLSSGSCRFALPSVPQSFDVVINEVLFNAMGNTRAEFVELYNRSQKVIDLASLRIGYGGTDLPEKSVTAVSSGFLLFPNEYVALCKHKFMTEEQYYVPYPSRLISCDSLPALSSSGGVVFLSDKHFNTIDRFQYNEQMHYPLLTSVSGVSLERVSVNRETQNENNWKSAAESYGFATPGYQNSQFSNNEPFQDIMKIVPEVFSPNQTGHSDYVEIHCGFEESDNRVSIHIFDRYGNLIKTIANNQICTLREVFLWDGVSERNYRVPPDLYIVKMDYWNLNTQRKTIKKTVGIIYP